MKIVPTNGKTKKTGSNKFHTKPVEPEPLVIPIQEAEALDERSREMVEQAQHEKELSE